MEEFEKVEKLRQRANISYEEAKNVLEQADGDLLDAMVILERQSKIKKPETEIITTANTGRRLLIIGDDWARSCLPLLVPSFEMILFLEPDSGDIHHEEPIKAEDYTDVWILCSQETFLWDARLANLLADGTIE